MLYFWAAKLALWVVFWILRYVPIVGAKLSGAYEDRVFRPVVENVSVESVRGELTGDPPSAVFEIELTNESWVDLELSAMDVRVGLSDEGSTVRNVVWAPVFDPCPKNIKTGSVLSEDDGVIGFEFLADSFVDEETTVYVDGCLVFEYSFTLRDHRFRFGTRNFPLDSYEVTLSRDED